ncbi:hypothetical protein [Sulfurimonas sp.]|uniref:hypothetical protein n=1 Tax=Sulfurimonas sp. TaxID=2022749 RepID=UPI002AB31C67|nr:hypothetical protein [Sulfurimonas sp.]
MIRLFFLGLLLLTTLSSNENTDVIQDIISSHNESESNQTLNQNNLQKVLYLNIEKAPTRVIKGEIFSLTLKTLSTVKNFTNITYELTNHDGLRALNSIPYRDKDSKYFYDTFYFLVLGSSASLPEFTATLHDNDKTIYKKTILKTYELEVVTLNPKKDFANIVANSFELLNYKTTTYDQQHNIIIFSAIATNCDLTAFKLQNVFKQGVESMTESYFDSKLLYYIIIDKKLEHFSFSFFNLKRNGFSLISIPIIVSDDSVTTQSDLKPKDQSKEILKMKIAAAFALLATLFIIFRKKYIYLVFVIIPLAYIAYLAIPSKEVCIKVGAAIYLLPVQNGTVFEVTNREYRLQKEGSVKKFIKVKLQNQKIGWVRNEDICSN